MFQSTNSIKNLIFTGRIFFGIALLGMGITHFSFGDFMTGRAPAWPDSLSGGIAWAYLTGTFFIGISLFILYGKKARSAALCAGLLIFLWAFLRHIPVLAADSFLSGAWTAAGKALILTGGAFVIAAISPKVKANLRPSILKLANMEAEFVVLGRICLGIFLIITGIQHFMFTDFVASLIPAWFPGDAIFWTFFAGVALIAGGAGLLIPQTAQLSSFLSGLMIFSWFWIVHLPRTFASVSDGIAVFEALAVSGIAFVITGALSKFTFAASSLLLHRYDEDNTHSRLKIPKT